MYILIAIVTPGLVTQATREEIFHQTSKTNTFGQTINTTARALCTPTSRFFSP